MGATSDLPSRAPHQSETAGSRPRHEPKQIPTSQSLGASWDRSAGPWGSCSHSLPSLGPLRPQSPSVPQRTASSKTALFNCRRAPGMTPPHHSGADRIGHRLPGRWAECLRSEPLTGGSRGCPGPGACDHVKDVGEGQCLWEQDAEWGGRGVLLWLPPSAIIILSS